MHPRGAASARALWLAERAVPRCDAQASARPANNDFRSRKLLRAATLYQRNCAFFGRQQWLLLGTRVPSRYDAAIPNRCSNPFLGGRVSLRACPQIVCLVTAEFIGDEIDRFTTSHPTVAQRLPKLVSNVGPREDQQDEYREAKKRKQVVMVVLIRLEHGCLLPIEGLPSIPFVSFHDDICSSRLRQRWRTP